MILNNANIKRKEIKYIPKKENFEFALYKKMFFTIYRAIERQFKIFYIFTV